MFNVNDTISWVSSAGELSGIITKAYRGLNAKNEMIDWMIVKYATERGFSSISMPINKNYIAMMRIQKV